MEFNQTAEMINQNPDLAIEILKLAYPNASHFINQYLVDFGNSVNEEETFSKSQLKNDFIGWMKLEGYSLKDCK